MQDLTRDGDKLICCLYKMYLEARRNGVDKPDARQFEDGFWNQSGFLIKMPEEDAKDTVFELERAGLVEMYTDGGFKLTDAAIVYMEQRFANGVKDVLDYIATIKSALL